MDSADVLTGELFRVEGTFERHLIIAAPTLPFSSLSAGCTLKLYQAAQSLYSRAVEPQAGESRLLPHPAVCAHACAAQHGYTPWLAVDNHVTFVLKLIFYTDTMFSFPWTGKLEQCCHLGFADILHWMLKQAMLAFIQKL